jgi:hypothetical protein
MYNIEPAIYSNGFTVSSNERSNIFRMLKEKMSCNEHLMPWYLLGKPYRLYRRGKNRCLKCGVKLTPVSM